MCMPEGLMALLSNTETAGQEKRILDPWHSRPLDVHRWTDHPELMTVLDSVWQAHCSALAIKGRSGPKPKQDFRYQLRVLLLDLYVAWLEDPDLSIGVSMSENDWHIWSRYNALNISKKIIELIHLLQRVGLIDMARGSYSGPYARTNRITRIRAAEPLRAMFQAARATRDDVYQVAGQECIILKGGDGEEAKLAEYEDTPETSRMRAEVTAYNQLLANTFIDIPLLDHPWIEREDGKRVAIDRHHQFVRRIFSRGDWGCNGRFYGPWWQQIGSDWRSKIFINDTPTVEVDYKGLHVQILSAEKGVVLDGDPYELPANLIPGAPPALQRTVVKKLVLTALNARTRKAAFASFREGFPAGHMAKGMTNAELEALLTRFIEKHPQLEEAICTDQGIRLMNVDARIAEIVLRHFTCRGIPVLSVHDSFIIEYNRLLELKHVMSLASQKVLGKEVPVSASGPGRDEFQELPLDAQQDFEGWRETERSKAYLERLADWEMKRNKVITSYSVALRVNTEMKRRKVRRAYILKIEEKCTHQHTNP